MSTTHRVYVIVLIAVLFWCGLILAAPLLQASTGHAQSLAALLYRFFSRICHQLAERSFQVNGHPLAVCIRCSSIYGGFLVGVLLFPFLRDWVQRSVSPRVLFLLASLPMIVDVALSLSGIHESTTWTRLGTGVLFGVAAPWMVLPPLLDALTQRRDQLSTSTGESLYARQTE
jgi:uncharacterized membrane protein